MQTISSRILNLLEVVGLGEIGPTEMYFLLPKIAQADYTLVIIGKEANKQHKDSYYIGYRNWQNYEIARSKAYGNRLVAVKFDYQYDSPEELLGSGASWAYSFNRDSILRALNNA